MELLISKRIEKQSILCYTWQTAYFIQCIFYWSLFLVVDWVMPILVLWISKHMYRKSMILTTVNSGIFNEIPCSACDGVVPTAVSTTFAYISVRTSFVAYSTNSSNIIAFNCTYFRYNVIKFIHTHAHLHTRICRIQICLCQTSLAWVWKCKGIEKQGRKTSRQDTFEFIVELWENCENLAYKYQILL